jgi:hypothetical protein
VDGCKRHPERRRLEEHHRPRGAAGTRDVARVTVERDARTA